MVGMLSPVWVLLDACGEAGQAEVEVGALRALDAHTVADVVMAVVAVEQSPAVHLSASAGQGLHMLQAQAPTGAQ